MKEEAEISFHFRTLIERHVARCEYGFFGVRGCLDAMLCDVPCNLLRPGMWVRCDLRDQAA